MRKILSLIKPMLLLLLFVAALEGCAQNSSALPPRSKIASLGFSVGSTALFGFEYARPISAKTWVRAGFNLMDLNIRKWETNFNRFEQYATIDLDIRNSSINLMVDHLVQPKLNLRFVTGLGFFFINQLSGSVKLRDPLKINDIYFLPDELGYVYGGVRYNLQFNPYIGMAIGKLTHPNRRFTASVDIGTYYKGAPEVFINGTAAIRNNEHNAEVLTNNMSGYRWFPVINLRFGYSIDPKDNP
ncbi:MAG: hypothetical protein KI786_03280 [Mameliella sp.]|nr:hypothetical protein [Phaeodactylibacter sp.]